MAAQQNHSTDELLAGLRAQAQELGFTAVGVTDTDLTAAEDYLFDWLAAGHHGEMEWMARHGTRRTRPAELEPGTVRVISARMDYLPEPAAEPWSVLADGELGYVSRYALGRDYHRLMRRRLQHLARWLEAAAGPLGYRVFTDSAPVMEKPLAEKAGLGWIGKHTNLLSREGGSWFFLGELYTDLPLPVDEPATAHCGSCRACIDACPTGAITAAGELDARLCISYLTIEHPGPIPVALRPLMGNRIYG
ncbi:MAG: tRNA epoxyqueuosine(34) reductase QueG, partial [Thiohalospira sp.]